MRPIDADALMNAFRTNEGAAALNHSVRTLFDVDDIIKAQPTVVDVKDVWINIDDQQPEPFVSVLGYMTDADQFPAVRECYIVNNGSFYFPALNEFHPVSHWMPMPEGPKGGDGK